MSQFLQNRTAYIDSSGNPLNGGSVTFYSTGTTTLKAIYTDVDLQIEAANPLILDGGGFPPLRYLNGAYAVIVKDKNGVTQPQYTADPIGGDPSLFGALGSWNSAVTYSIKNTVQGSDGKYYTSIINSNLNKDPTTPNLDSWTEIQFINVWNTNETYEVGDTVKGSDFELYRCLTEQSGNDPTTDFSRVNWVNLGMSKAAKAGALSYATTL